VECPHILVVDPQVGEGAGESGDAGSSVSVGLGVCEPAEPGGDVGQDCAGDHEDECPPHVRDERPAHGRRVAEPPTVGDLANGDENAEAGEDVDAGPLYRGRQAAQDAGGEQPGAPTRVGADREAVLVAQGDECPQVGPAVARGSDAVPCGELASQRWA